MLGASNKGSLDPTVEKVIEISKEYPEVCRIFWFGSRVSGQFRENSDYDFGFEMTGDSDKIWGELCGKLREQNPQLNQLDLVDLNYVSSKLKNEIQSKGKIVYERS